MANRATRCPHCQTSFRVTESQLATARGRVRCGACLEVFNATTNWVDPAPSQADMPEPEPRYDDNTPFPEDETEASAYQPAAEEQPAIDEQPAAEAFTPRDETPVYKEEEERAADTELQIEECDDDAAIDNVEINHAAIDDNDEQADDHYRFNALETDSAPEELEHFSSHTEDSEDSNDYPDFTSAESPDDEFSTEPESTADPVSNAQAMGIETGDTPLSPENALPEPSHESEDDDFDALVAHQRRRIQISRRQLGWTLLCLLAAAFLAGQIVYTNFSGLAQSQHRNALVETCKVINWAWGGPRCVLPPPRNLSRIDSLGLNIMSHPRYTDSLLVDTIILNRARFEQPFPLIELIFRNDRGNVVARRAFAPDEYLAGELQGIELMPVGQSVRINISIADPGSTAVNYEMQFLPATES